MNDTTAPDNEVFPGWEARDILVLGADAGDRARVRQVLREARVLALTDDDPAVQVRVAVSDGRLGCAQVDGADNGVAPGITMAELRERLSAAAPDGLILDGSEEDPSEQDIDAGGDLTGESGPVETEAARPWGKGCGSGAPA